jgi:hypothetical protein
MSVRVIEPKRDVSRTYHLFTSRYEFAKNRQTLLEVTLLKERLVIILKTFAFVNRFFQNPLA